MGWCSCKHLKKFTSQGFAYSWQIIYFSFKFNNLGEGCWMVQAQGDTFVWKKLNLWQNCDSAKSRADARASPAGSGRVYWQPGCRGSAGFDRSCKLTPLSAVFPLPPTSTSCQRLTQKETHGDTVPQGFLHGGGPFTMPMNQVLRLSKMQKCCHTGREFDWWIWLIPFKLIIYFLSSTVPYLSHQTDVLYSSNVHFSLIPV